MQQHLILSKCMNLQVEISDQLKHQIATRPFTQKLDYQFE